MHQEEKMDDSTDEKNFQAQLVEQIQSINQWKDLPDMERRIAVKRFMKAIGHLYLDYYQFHLAESKACAYLYRSILEKSIDPGLSYISKLEHRLRSADAMDEPWEEACRGRTNIEAFNSMFGDSVEILDPELIESYMQDRKGTVYMEDECIPKNAPASHWWWFEKY